MTVIDGEKYYTAEYLERTEFNPERKKRFYHIPTGNLNGSWQMVEREKGIDQSWFKRTVKPSTLQPVALGSHYAILDQSDLLKALPSRCFSLPKQSKKMLSREKNVSLFIKPTFQEGFDYQLVQLKGTPTYVSLMAFADRQQSPRYYWPLVVFLDHAGCVVEGASAFLSQTHAATMLQQAALEGVLRVPEQSQFMLLTPLQQAVDVPDAQLTNQGQIRLAVLR